MYNVVHQLYRNTKMKCIFLNNARENRISEWFLLFLFHKMIWGVCCFFSFLCNSLCEIKIIYFLKFGKIYLLNSLGLLVLCVYRYCFNFEMLLFYLYFLCLLYSHLSYSFMGNYLFLCFKNY